MREPLLVVEHEAQCPPGWLGEWLTQAGIGLDVARPYDGRELPHDLTGHSGMLVLGGDMGAHDDATHPWLTDVKRLVVTAGDRPVLGVCLGHQLVAVALGGEVARNPRGQQIGVLPVGWTPAAHHDRLLAQVADLARPEGGGPRPEVPAVQWNDDVVTVLPPGAVALARTPAGELQAARFAPSVWGVQWHPEAGGDLVASWVEHDREATTEQRSDVRAHLADVVAAHDGLRSAWGLLATRFAGLLTSRVGDPSAAR